MAHPSRRASRAPQDEVGKWSRSEYGSRIIRLRNAAGALHAAPRRRCADPGASAVGMVRPCADAGRGHGARQYGPRSARPGARALFLCREGRRQGQRRGQVRLSARRQAVPQSAAAGAAERRFRPHHGAAVLLRGLRRPLLARDDEAPAIATLAAIAAKSEKESAYHVRHSSEWIVRLGDGTEESHARAQAAIDDLWAFTGEMFEVDDSERGLIDAGIAVDPAALRSQWLKTISGVVERGDAGSAEQRLDAAGRPQRPAQRASRPSPQRTAIDAADLSGGDMVTAVLNDADLRQRAWDAAATVVDPEIPVLTIADLGVLRDVADPVTAASRSRSRRPIPAVPR